jgi:hypothetical protein
VSGFFIYVKVLTNERLPSLSQSFILTKGRKIMEETIVVAEDVEIPSHEPTPVVPVEEPTPVTPKEKKGEEVIPPTEENLLDGIEKLEDGSYKLVAGDSTYYGKTQKEVHQNLLKGKIEQDQAIRKAKAAEIIKIPDELRGTKPEEAPILELPDDAEVYSTHLASEVKKAGVDAKMLSWTDADWDRYQDEQGLKDRHIIRLQDGVRDAIERANKLADRDMSIASVAVDNNKTLEQSTKNVQKMLAKSGVVDQYTPEMFKTAIEKAMAEKDKSGRIPGGAIEAEVSDQITKIMRSNTPVKKDLAAEAARVKGRIKTPADGGKVEDDDKTILGYDALSRKVKSELPSRAGREI